MSKPRAQRESHPGAYFEKLVGEHSLYKVLHEFKAHYMAERPHQGIGNRLVEPEAPGAYIPSQQDRPLEWECRQCLGGLLKSDSRKTA